VELDRRTGPAVATDDDLLELDDALDRLANEFPVAAELVKLRFFAGLTLGDAAEAMGIPHRTADRHWAFARAWLADALAGGESKNISDPVARSRARRGIGRGNPNPEVKPCPTPPPD